MRKNLRISPRYAVYQVVLGMPFFPALNLVAVFICIGVGADDVFVFLDQWRDAADDGLARDAVGDAARDAADGAADDAAGARGGGAPPPWASCDERRGALLAGGAFSPTPGEKPTSGGTGELCSSDGSCSAAGKVPCRSVTGVGRTPAAPLAAEELLPPPPASSGPPRTRRS